MFISYLFILVVYAISTINQANGWETPSSNQYHIQTDEGPERYFRYQTDSGQYRKEKRLEDGTVVGTYAWIDANGFLRQRDYIADNQGYRILKSKNVFVGNNVPIGEAVKSAKKHPPSAGTLVKTNDQRPVVTVPYKAASPSVVYGPSTPTPPTVYLPSSAPPSAPYVPAGSPSSTYIPPGYGPSTIQSTTPSPIISSTPSPYNPSPYNPVSSLVPAAPSTSYGPSTTSPISGVYGSSTASPIPASTVPSDYIPSSPSQSYIPSTAASPSTIYGPSTTTPSPYVDISSNGLLATAPGHLSSTVAPHVVEITPNSIYQTSYSTSSPREYYQSTVNPPTTYGSPQRPPFETLPPYATYNAAEINQNGLEYNPHVSQSESTYRFQNGPTYPIDQNGKSYVGKHIGNGYDPQYPEYDGVSVTNDGFRYYIPRAYHEEQTLPNDDRSGSFGYIDPFGIRRVIYYNTGPGKGFQHRKNNRYVGFDATPYDPRPTY